MFQLYDKTRRRLCLAGFLLFGVAPAALIGGWCFGRYSPGYVAAEAQRLGVQLGLDVKLGGLEYPRPGKTRYGQFEALDPETGRPVFRCRELEISSEQRTDDQGRTGPVLAIVASQPEIEAASLDIIRRCIERTMEGFCGPLCADLRFSAADLTLRADKNSQTLTEVGGTMEEIAGGVNSRIEFRLPDASSPEPAYVRLVRNRQVSPPAFGFELDTGGGELPCNVLAFGMGELKSLGRRCRFSGSIWANETPDGWLGEVKGQLADLDLGGLVSDCFQYRLTGAGNVVIQSAKFNCGRLEQGGISVSAGPGTIDRLLVQAAVERLGLAAGTKSPPEDDQIQYEQLAFRASLDAGGLRLYGQCTKSEPGTILDGGRECLLGEPLVQPSPITALVRTLVPESTVQVPAGRQTDWLLRHLPVPEAKTFPGSDAMVPKVRVRLR